MPCGLRSLFAVKTVKNKFLFVPCGVGFLQLKNTLFVSRVESLQKLKTMFLLVLWYALAS